MNNVYQSLLEYFNVCTDINDIIYSRSYVSIDDIHDAILHVGLNFDEDLSYYIIKAKQFAINNYSKNKRRSILFNKYFNHKMHSDFNFNILGEYGFSDDELDLILELLYGIKAYKSSIPRRKYNTILKNIKNKLILHHNL